MRPTAIAARDVNGTATHSLIWIRSLNAHSSPAQTRCEPAAASGYDFWTWVSIASLLAMAVRSPTASPPNYDRVAIECVIFINAVLSCPDDPKRHVVLFPLR